MKIVKCKMQNFVKENILYFEFYNLQFALIFSGGC